MRDETVLRFERAYWQAFRELDGVRLRHWERHRVTLPQLRVIYQIRRAPGVMTGELATALGITVSTASGLVIKLADRGLVDRGTNADDRRQAPLHLTAAGQELAGELADVGHVFTGEVAARLGPDLATVTAALEQLAMVAGIVGTELHRAERQAEPEE